MCGICGIFLKDRQRVVDRAALEAMNAQIVHRGPDDGGFYCDGHVGLAMRRLSIIDVATGHQPISNETGDVWIVYNGEIYNHAVLRRDLEARGHCYRTKSDTETIVHLYEEYGRACVNHLRGMFAFVIWDKRRRVLLGARDRLGIKPFYYLERDGVFLFGSEIKTILTYPEVSASFRRAALAEYLAFGYLSGEDTMYAGIRKLMPGHWFEIAEDGRMITEQYWDLELDANAAGNSASEPDFVCGYRERLEACVSSHLMSDVPLGVFLSGGLDSSAVAALTARIRGDRIKTFSVGYGEARFSELGYAKEVADHIGTEHHEVRVSRHDFFDALPKLIWHEDEPIVWPSSVALYFVAKLAREHVVVVLTGEGSDETLAGYTRYAWTQRNANFDRTYRALTPEFLRTAVRSVAGTGMLGADLHRKLEHTFLVRDGRDWASFYFDNFYSAFAAEELASLLTPAAQAEAGDAYTHVLGIWQRSQGDLIQRLLYTDIKTYLVELLMKQDQMSMAASIESRVPFLDHALVEYATNIPQRHTIRGLAGKFILKRAVEDVLPHSIIYRKKMGFPTPWAGWLAHPEQSAQIENLLLEPRALDRGLFRREEIQRLFAEHRCRQRDHNNRIWRLLNLETWLRVCVEGRGTASSARTSS
jgi:asparagine synthase (glutamine-hydrolysing)